MKKKPKDEENKTFFRMKVSRARPFRYNFIVKKGLKLDDNKVQKDKQ